MTDRNRLTTVRIGGLALAVGAGAVIACSAAAPASADGNDTGRGTQSSVSTPSQPRSSDAPSRRATAETRSRTADRSATNSSRHPAVDEVDTAPDVDVLDEEPTPAPAEAQPEPDIEAVATTGTPAVRPISDTPARRVAEGTTTPAEPPSVAPGIWTLLGSARRQSVETPTAATQPEAADTREAGVATTTAPSDPLEDVADLYTGEPSFVHNVVTAGLYVLQAVLKPFGGLLAFTSLKVPFFTDGIPPFFLRAGLNVERSEFEGMKVWTLTPRKNPTDKAIVALHGGAYMATASIFHWWTYVDMARDTGATVIVPLQTLVPAGGTAASEVPRTADFITAVIDERGARNVSVIGDSAGGGLGLAAVQELVRRNSRLPSRLVLLAPWLDVSMSDPRSARIPDPLLDLTNLIRAGEKWAGTAGATNPQASPLFGALEGLPPTYVYSSSLDLITVDTLRLRDRVLAEQIPDVEFRLRKGLIHDWFTFPFLPDAHEDRASVYQDLLGTGDRPRVRRHAA
ncbi:alpha/beta hydrolase fold domain-containing protein [Mycobacterium sp. SMC-4]|uniref:alpha/beta hydrolase fold domain-containing protein n=1 Tax=Mycobacterium sp. SMC-4 TaxID=2857059 RepID=UPI003D08DE45